jgi:hypothetical protein
MLLLVLAGCAVLLLPFSVRDRRDGRPARALPTVRAASLTAGASVGVVAAVGLYFLLLRPPALARVPHLTAQTLAAKYAQFTNAVRFPVLFVLAGAGLAAGWIGAARTRRIGLLVLGGWAALGGVAVLAYEVTGIELPAYRVVLGSLGLVVLPTCLVVAAARWTARSAGVAGAVDRRITRRARSSSMATRGDRRAAARVAGAPGDAGALRRPPRSAHCARLIDRRARGACRGGRRVPAPA